MGQAVGVVARASFVTVMTLIGACCSFLQSEQWCYWLRWMSVESNGRREARVEAMRTRTHWLEQNEGSYHCTVVPSTGVHRPLVRATTYSVLPTSRCHLSAHVHAAPLGY
jgi:hypothetical protein